MAITVRGATTGYHANAKQSLAWPAGTQADDMAMLFLGENKDGYPDSRPDSTGWTAVASGTTWTIWRMRVGAGDIATALTATGHVAILVTLGGVGRVGNVANAKTVKVTTTGGGTLTFARNDAKTATLTPASGKIASSEVVNSSWAKRRSAAWYVAQTKTGTKGIGSSNASAFTTLELVAPVAPLTPKIVSPMAGSQAPEGDTVTLAWVHNSAQGDTQDQSQIRRSVDGGVSWLIRQPNGTWSAADTWTNGDSAAVAVGVPVGADQVSYQVRTAEVIGGAARPSPWSASLTLPVFPRPAVASVSVATTAEDLSPVVTWAATTAPGTTVAAARVRVLAGATVLVDSWWMPWAAGDPLEWVVPATTPWVRGQSVTAEVTVRQTGVGGLASLPTASAAFAVTWTPPTAPTVAAASTTVPAVTVGSVSDIEQLHLETSWLDGVTWTAWQDAGTTPRTTESQQIPTPGLPYGRYWRARVRTGKVNAEGVLLWSDWVTAIAPQPNADRRTMLVDGTDSIELATLSERRGVRQDVVTSYGLGGGMARVDTYEPQGQHGTLTAATLTAASYKALVAWLRAHPAWWLRMGPERSPVDGSMASPDLVRCRWVPGQAPERILERAVQPRRLAIDWVETND